MLHDIGEKPGKGTYMCQLIVDQLTRNGDVDPGLLYEAPFTAVALTGPEGIFTGAQVAASMRCALVAQSR